jgi:hypothetical protein
MDNNNDAPQAVIAHDVAAQYAKEPAAANRRPLLPKTPTPVSSDAEAKRHRVVRHGGQVEGRRPRGCRKPNAGVSKDAMAQEPNADVSKDTKAREPNAAVSNEAKAREW